MKTKLCRPVLIESKEKLTIGKLAILDNRLITIISEFQVFAKPQQLIFISLDTNDKIKVGDVCYNEDLGIIFTCTDVEANLTCEKVVVNQSKLSPEYIQQFVEEYNRKEVKDVEIEMKESKLLRGNIPSIYSKEIPKLTNGFVTIVEKEPILYQL